MFPTAPLLLALAAAAPGLDVLDNSALDRELRALAQSPRADLVTLAASRGGRALQALELRGATQRRDGTPAILVVAGLDGPHAYTSTLAVDHARRLVEGYGSDEEITAFLDSTTVYVLPRLDPDGAAAREATPRAERLGTGAGVDNDRDGRQGEDPRADVNGDGLVTRLRVPDSQGEWIIDPTDPRAMRKADRTKGELGQYALYDEGYDADGDERVAEDGEHDAQVNRNFPRDWSEHAPSSGRYPTDEPGVLGAVEFVLAREDLALVLAYGEEGNLVGKPATQPDSGPSKRGAMSRGLFESDAQVLAELGDRYRKLTENKTEGLGEQPGSFTSWLYHHRGLWTLNVNPWSVPLDFEPEQPESDGDTPSTEPEAQSAAPEPGDEAKRLLWFDAQGIDAFVPWTPLAHPQLGEVEVGGFRPYVLFEPPTATLDQLAEEHFDHLLSLAELLPRPVLGLEDAKSLGGGLYEFSATLRNDALLPLRSRAAARSRAQRPLQVHLELPAGGTLVAGQERTLVSSLDAAGGELELRWLVTLPDDAEALSLRVAGPNTGPSLTIHPLQNAEEAR